MPQRESLLYNRLRANLIRPNERFDRVENGVLDGMPDVNYVILRKEGWIELKAPQVPKRKNTSLFGSNHPVSIAQGNWFHRQHAAGGTAWLLIGTEYHLILIEGRVVADAGDRINRLTTQSLIDRSTWHRALPIRDVEMWIELREFLAGIY